MEPPPEHCPGVESTSAGTGSACAGCPNQSLCSTGAVSKNTGEKLIDCSSLSINSPGYRPPPISQSVDNAVLESLRDVKHKLFVLSGKGGVGKSTVTNLLVRAIAKTTPEKNYSVLDLDICGPSQPRAFGVQEEQVHQSGSGWSPIFVDENLSVMSIGFLLSSPDDAIIWRGPKKNGMIRQFLADVDWGELECLVIDTPPGTSDEHLSAMSFLEKSGSVAAVIVTTPQEVALLDVRKEINFCRKMKIPIVGIIENMSGFICSKCTKESQIFPAKSGGAQRMAEEMNVPLLGRLPLDPRIAQCTDKGADLIADYADSKTVEGINEIAVKITEYFEKGQ